MPTAPPTRCLITGCAAFAVRRGRCEDHYVAWEQTSARNRELTDRERSIFRRDVLRRDKVCQACHTAPATQADHILPVADGGARRDLSNGQGLCGPCHDAKTRAENARRNQHRAATRTADHAPQRPTHTSRADQTTTPHTPRG